MQGAFFDRPRPSDPAGLNVTGRCIGFLGLLALAVLAGCDGGSSSSTTTTTVTVKATSAATSSTNPIYSATVLVSDWTPITGKVGELVAPSITWKVSGAVTRATT